MDSTIIVLQDPITYYPIWETIWSKYLIPKINIFQWLLLKNEILTLNNLARRGMVFPNSFFLCEEDLELVDHFFSQCPFS